MDVLRVAGLDAFARHEGYSKDLAGTRGATPKAHAPTNPDGRNRMIRLSKSSWSRWMLRAMLMLFFWLVIPVVLVEIAMIVLEPYLFNGFYQYEPDIGFRVRTNARGANQFGFNDRD